jgi:uncharacterized protein VirK/YbjX
MKSFKCFRNTTTNRKVIFEEIKEQFKLRECLLTARSEYFNFLFCPTNLQDYKARIGTLVCMNVKLDISYLSTGFCTDCHREGKQEDLLSDQMVESFALRSFSPWYPHSTHILTSGLQGVPQVKKQGRVFKNVVIKFP